MIGLYSPLTGSSLRLSCELRNNYLPPNVKTCFYISILCCRNSHIHYVLYTLAVGHITETHISYNKIKLTHVLYGFHFSAEGFHHPKFEALTAPLSPQKKDPPKKRWLSDQKQQVRFENLPRLKINFTEVFLLRDFGELTKSLRSVFDRLRLFPITKI